MLSNQLQQPRWIPAQNPRTGDAAGESSMVTAGFNLVSEDSGPWIKTGTEHVAVQLCWMLD
jgi:hypothetical protein